MKRPQKPEIPDKPRENIYTSYFMFRLNGELTTICRDEGDLQKEQAMEIFEDSWDEKEYRKRGRFYILGLIRDLNPPEIEYSPNGFKELNSLAKSLNLIKWSYADGYLLRGFVKKSKEVYKSELEEWKLIADNHKAEIQKYEADLVKFQKHLRDKKVQELQKEIDRLNSIKIG